MMMMTRMRFAMKRVSSLFKIHGLQNLLEMLRPLPPMIDNVSNFVVRAAVVEALAPQEQQRNYRRM
jgi:hypothetical protein